KDKTLKPIVAPAQRIYSSLASVFGSDPGPDARIAKTQGWRALWTGGSLAGKLTHKTTDVKDLRKLIATYIKNGSLDQAGKDQIKDILKRNKPTLGTTNVKDFQELVDNFSVYERPTNADQHIKDGLQSLIPELRKAGLGEKIEREEVIDLLLRSTEGTQIINAINTGGLSQKKADDLIEEIMDNIGRGNYSTTPTFNGQKINADILKNSLASIIPVTAPKSGSEREKMLGGTAGTIHHEMSEVIDKHKPGSSSRTALTAFQTTIEGRLNASLRAGIISITDKNGIKKQIEKELDNLVKAKTIEENEADQIKEKLYFQIETMPVAKMKPGEFWKEVSKNMAKWSGKKLSVPFSILAATFESLRDHGGIPIFDFDILTKEIKNFNARRTRRREADKLGQWHDVMNLWISLGKDKTDYKGTELMSRVSEEKKMVYDKTQGETHATLNELYDAWQAGDHPKAVGAYMILAENNDLNELWKGDFSGKFLPIMKNMLETQYVGKNVRVWDDTSKSYSNKTINQKEIGQIIQTSKEKGGVNIGFARLFTENLTKLAGKSDAVAAKLGNMIGMIALENGSPHMGYGASSYNPKTERMEFAPLEIFVDNSGRLDFTLSRRSMSEITAKLKNMSQRKVTNMIHPGMFAQEDINGQMRGINPLNESFLMTLSSTLLERPHEMRDDVVTKLTASSEWRGSITRLVSDMMINADYYLRYYSDYFASREDVLKQARLISQFPARLLASRYKEFNK
ncbi:MAG: hypothetical protein KGZ85_05425, partial [Ignavibacterium sp.]|nr:hypothetical protein [Ignavibacterium sp.]